MAANQRTGPERPGIISRSTPILCLLVPALVSIVLISMERWRDFGLMRDWVESTRTTVSVLVQLISSMMGMLQISALTMLIKYGARIRLVSSPTKLDTIGLLTAISIPRIPWNLPLRSLTIAMAMVLAAQGPGALWAGAITPFTVQQPQELGSAMVPVFSQATQGTWDSEFGTQGGYVWNYVQNCTAITADFASVSNCPVPNYQSVLLDAAREATSSTGAPKNHSKPDNPSWTYHGRSYGVGASQGLLPLQDIPSDFKLLGYSYSEVGYFASVDCQFNKSANLIILRSGRVELLDVWSVTGTLPNSVHHEFYPIISWLRENIDDAPLLSWTAVSNQGEYMIGVVACAMYGDLQNLQCAVTFTPTQFSIAVNSTEQSMTVSPIRDTEDTVEPTGQLKTNAIWSLNLVARMSPTLYVSALGEALQFNVNTTKRTFRDLNATEAVLRATEDSFEAMLDDILGIYGGAQLVMAKAFEGAPIAGQFAAVRIGQPWYQYAVAAVNLGLLCLIGLEGVKSRWWRRLPLFDVLDFKNIVAASSFGGNAIAREVERLHHECGSKWAGDPEDRLLGQISVRLQSMPGNQALLLSNSPSTSILTLKEHDAETQSFIRRTTI